MSTAIENKDEALNKSIDELLAKLFEAKPTVEKAMDAKHEIIGAPILSKEGKNDPNTKPATTSDEGTKGAKPEEDEEEGKGKADAKSRGRPSDMSQMSQRDMKTGESKGPGYDAAITHASVSVPNETTKTGPSAMKKSFEVSEEDYAMLQEAKRVKGEEQLRKARDEQVDLIKSAVGEATRGLRDENEALKKSLADTNALIKSMARKPVPQKAITHSAVLEKSFSGAGGEGTPQRETFSKAEMLDVAEELVKAKKLGLEHVIELEDTGFLYNPAARAILEAELKKRA